MALASSTALPRFGLWRVAAWVVLLLAALGGVQYLRQGDYAYLAGAFVVIVACAGCILRQPWARSALRVVALLLVLWALASGGLLLTQWGQFAQARAHALAQPSAQAQVLLLVIEQARRSFLLGLVLKALLIPLLLWLAWVLGRPTVRAQFPLRG